MRNFRGEVRAKTWTSLDLMGFDFYAEISFRFTAGSPASWDKSIGTWLPSDPPTWEVLGLTLQLDVPGKSAPAWKLDGEAFVVLSEHPKVLDAIHTYLWT